MQTVINSSKLLNTLRPLRRYSRNFQTLSCSVNENSSNFKENAAKMKEVMKTFHAIIDENVNFVNQKAEASHLSKNKLLVRDRINKLLDPDTAFLELSQVAGYRMYGSDILPAGGIVTGIGCVSGEKCMIIANDATVKGGTYYPITVKKNLRAQEIAEENKLPCIYLTDSGGANLQYASELFADKEDFGQIFYNIAKMSGKGIPQIAVVMGSCTAGGAYIPSMCDESIIVKGNGTVFLAGPPLVKAATGEVVTAEELGGADVHCQISGVTDHYAENDEHALQITKIIVSRIKNEKIYEVVNQTKPRPALYPAEHLYSVVDPLTNTVDMKRLIACLVDGSELDEFKRKYAEELITGFAHLNGYLIGIVANNGVLFSKSALKATHFIELCNQRKIPLLFIQNISGFIVGKEAESGGIAKDGAKMVTAVSCAQVPKISLIVGNASGAGYFAMCGRAYNPRFMYMWPNTKIGIMGGSQAADVLSAVKKMTPEQRDKLRLETQKKFEEHGSPYYANARLWADGVIDPADTRQVLTLSFTACLKESVEEKAQYGIFRM